MDEKIHSAQKEWAEREQDKKSYREKWSKNKEKMKFFFLLKFMVEIVFSNQHN